MPTYLVAFVVAKSFKKSCTTPVEQDPTEVCVWSRESAVDQHGYALAMGHKSLAYLSYHLQIAYPLVKMDMVAIPDFAAGAMENWGLSTYREAVLLYKEKDSPAAAKQSVGQVIVHELTHQWFGNLVSPEWWSYTWLKEAFAGYYQFIITQMVS